MNEPQPIVTPGRDLPQPSAAGQLRLQPPAKINLNLLVDRKADSGYHPLDSIVAHISLHDTLDMTLRTDGELTFHSDGIDCGPARSNLAFEAARILRRLVGSVGIDVPGADIHLTKAIPPGSGLGGGSSDAAFVLLGLNELWQLGRSREQLAVLAEELGSDVPLFLAPPTLRMTGRGEDIQPVEVHPFWALLHTPQLHCPTRDVYQAFDADPSTMAAQLDLATFTQPPSTWQDQLVNQLAAAAMAVEPALAERYRQLSDLLPAPVCVTGSGSAMFMLADTQADARNALQCLPDDLRQRTHLVHSLDPPAAD